MVGEKEGFAKTGETACINYMILLLRMYISSPASPTVVLIIAEERKHIADRSARRIGLLPCPPSSLLAIFVSPHAVLGFMLPHDIDRKTGPTATKWNWHH